MHRRFTINKGKTIISEYQQNREAIPSSQPGHQCESTSNHHDSQIYLCTIVHNSYAPDLPILRVLQF